MPPIPAAALGATGGGSSRIWLSHDELGCDRVGVVGVASDGRGAVWGTGVLGNRCGVTTTARGSVAGDGAGSSSSAVLGVGDGRAGPVGVLNPQKVPCKALQSAARFYKHIRESALQASQFPPVLTDGQGSFHKPPSW